MEFRTRISINPRQPKIDHSSRIFLAGSCFVENIGNKLNYYKIQNFQNPFGILYHPAAIENFITRTISGYVYTAEDVFFHNERWHCFESHSVMSNQKRPELLEDLNKNLRLSREYLEKTTHVIITFGTSWFYRNSNTGEPVANCHKLPQKNFSKEILGVEEIYRSINSAVKSIRSINPETEIIFTVSPVRHIKDGMVENQRSKAHLIAALQEFIEKDDGKNFYFSSYEIMMDDLRDYRFYGEDMIHPNSTAIDYIWEKFVETWFSPEGVTVLKRIGAIQKSLSHRSFNPNSEGHKVFQNALQKKIEELQRNYPSIHF